MKKYAYLVFLLALLLFMPLCKNKSNDDNNNDNNPPPPPQFSHRILMLGRSVMGGWFEHWGNSEHVNRNGYDLYYGQMESPPDIVTTAIQKINQQNVDATWAVFFKFCFVDFYGNSRQDAEYSLNEKKQYLEQIRQEVRTQRNAILIIGNALPETCNNTSQNLIWLHKEYNAWVNQLASSDSRIKVFDQYSVLATAGGCLKQGYAQDPWDAHLTNQAYNALDQQFFPFLNANVQKQVFTTPTG